MGRQITFLSELLEAVDAVSPTSVRPSRDSRHFSLGGVGHSKSVREARMVPTYLLACVCFSLADFATTNSRARCEKENTLLAGTLRSRTATFHLKFM